MKYFLTILFISVLVALSVGFYVQGHDEAKGNVVIGLSLMAGFFILMPLFIYHRWKNKDVKDYMLTRENIEKMNDFGKKKKTKS